MSEICFLAASEMADRIRQGELSSRQVVEAHLRQIDRVNPAVNAIVTLVQDQALSDADRADQEQAAGRLRGPLHGLPVVHKDLFLTHGVRTTFGSTIFQNHVPNRNSLLVERLKQAGAIMLGKTNTPEFGAGSQTFNELFGPTRNPYDLSKTCGGSSGGSAVALACGMAPLADGSDIGGSLRNPANYCNVVGMRPSPGRVPIWPAENAWAPLGVEGPMARTVADVALMLSAIAGPDPRDPTSNAESGQQFAEPLDRNFQGVRIAWSRDLGGLPVDPAVTAAIDARRAGFEGLGCQVIDDCPSFSGADEAFKVLRAWNFELHFRQLIKSHRDELKDTIQWNVEQGQQLTGPQISRAELFRTRLYQRVRRFFDAYEFLIVPVSQAPPFDVTTPYVAKINGHAMETYIDWMKSCYFISVTGLPAISVPCGFTPDGLPVGLQIVGRPRADFEVLQLAFAFEQATRTGDRRPEIALPA